MDLWNFKDPLKLTCTFWRSTVEKMEFGTLESLYKLGICAGLATLKIPSKYVGVVGAGLQ